jgi:hypothetical protein
MRNPVEDLGREVARDYLWPGPPSGGMKSRCCRLADWEEPQEPDVDRRDPLPRGQHRSRRLAKQV